MYDWGNIYSKKTGKMLNQKYVGLKVYLNKTVYSPWIRDWFEGQRALRHTIQAPHIYAAAYAVASGCCISVPVLACVGVVGRPETRLDPSFGELTTRLNRLPQHTEAKIAKKKIPAMT